MSSAHEAHQEACAAANAKIDDLMAHIAALKEAAHEALDSAIYATGEAPVESASVVRAVLASIAQTKSDDLMEAAAQAKAEMERYAGGF